MNNVTRRHSILGSIAALIVAPTVVKANSETGYSPTSVFARHPRHRPLDCYYPARRIEGGENDGEVWYLDCFHYSTAESAKIAAATFLSMNPTPFDKATTFKQTGTSVNQVDYVTVSPEKWPLPLL